MARLFTLQSGAGLGIAGAAAGILIGNAAVDAIDPFFYSPLPSQSFASLSPYRSPTTGSAGVIEASAEDGRYALGNGCIGCRTYPEEYRPDSSLEQQMPDDYHAASLGAEYGFRTDESPTESTPPAPDPERDAIARYASYQVTQAPEPAPAVPVIAPVNPAIAEHADAEAIRAAEDKAVPRGPEPLIY